MLLCDGRSFLEEQRIHLPFSIPLLYWSRGKRRVRKAAGVAEQDAGPQGHICMKKLINTPDRLVHDALAGLEAAHADLLRVQYDPDIVVRIDAPVPNKVGIVSGGGSGHEPLHGGFVGRGMLDAACPGAIFTSPVPDQILAATKAVDGGAGVLLIVKNYSGDVMNFEMAAELAQMDGVELSTVLIDDDVAVKDSLFTAGRRGVGTTVIAEKLAGAAAEEGQPLAEVLRICEKADNAGRSIGIALTSCTVPAVGSPTFELGEDEMEFGIGIHGEPGRRRMPLLPVADVVALMAEALVEDLPFRRGDQVLAMVNGMGATPLIELYTVYYELDRYLKGLGIQISRRLVGNFVTSLDMAGCSITLVRLDEEMLRLWDAPVITPALRWGT